MFVPQTHDEHNQLQDISNFLYCIQENLPSGVILFFFLLLRA